MNPFQMIFYSLPAQILMGAATLTANLDGETNLKIRKALEKTWDYVTPERVSEFKGEIQCEQPNNSLYTFTGNMIINKQTSSVLIKFYCGDVISETPNTLLVQSYLPGMRQKL